MDVAPDIHRDRCISSGEMLLARPQQHRRSKEKAQMSGKNVPMKAQSNSNLLGNPGFYSQYASIIVILIGALGLAGWTFGIGTFKNVFQGFPKMAPNTALAFLLAGGSLCLQRSEFGTPRRFGQLCAFFVALIGAI